MTMGQKAFTDMTDAELEHACTGEEFTMSSRHAARMAAAQRPATAAVTVGNGATSSKRRINYKGKPWEVDPCWPGVCRIYPAGGQFPDRDAGFNFSKAVETAPDDVICAIIAAFEQGVQRGRWMGENHAKLEMRKALGI